MTLQQHDVLGVRLPRRVEQVSEHRNYPDECVDADVRQHANQRDGWHAGTRRFEDDVTGKNASDHIPDSWNQTDNGIEPDSSFGAGDRNRVVEQLPEHANTFRAPRQLSAYLARL